jgi:hypothetical protein
VHFVLGALRRTQAAEVERTRRAER